MERLQVSYETKYKHYEGISQPQITASFVNVDIFPKKRSVFIKGSYTLKNKTESNIDSIHILLNPESTDPFRISTLQAIRDPWLKFVYIGFGMLLMGVIHLIWSIRKFPKEDR